MVYFRIVTVYVLGLVSLLAWLFLSTLALGGAQGLDEGIAHEWFDAHPPCDLALVLGLFGSFDS